MQKETIKNKISIKILLTVFFQYRTINSKILVLPCIIYIIAQFEPQTVHSKNLILKLHCKAVGIGISGWANDSQLTIAHHKICIQVRLLS